MRAPSEQWRRSRSGSNPAFLAWCGLGDWPVLCLGGGDWSLTPCATSYPGRGLPHGGATSLTHFSGDQHPPAVASSFLLPGGPRLLGQVRKAGGVGDMPARSPQARALRLGMGRHLRATLSLAEPRFSSGLFVPRFHAPLWPLCSLGTCQIYHLPATKYGPCSASTKELRKVGL